MNLLPRDTFQRVLFLLFLGFLVGSCVAPPYAQFLLMQHVPTIFAVMLLSHLSNRFVISRLSFASIILFLALHTIDAHKDMALATGGAILAVSLLVLSHRGERAEPVTVFD